MPKKTKKIILDVVPLTKIPLKTSPSFSYLSEKEFPAGTLVSVSLWHRQVKGIVLGSKKNFPRLGNIELKNITEVLEENFLNEKQLELARFISDYYLSPLGIVTKSFVPQRKKSRKLKECATKDGKQTGLPPEIKLTKEQSQVVSVISKKKTGCQNSTKKYLLFGPSASGKTEVYIHSILALKKKYKHAQFLILLPEKTLTPQALERYGAYFAPEEIVTLGSNLAKGNFYSNWQKIKSGEAKIIIGTRMAVFAPFKNLKLIVIDEEQDMSYKNWDMNPRYDARTVGEKLAEIHHCPIVRGSATPAIESYYKALNKKDWTLLRLPELFLAAKPLSEIIDMKKERWAKNYSVISKKLKSEIAYALKYKQQTILLINRQGMSAFSICDSCKTVLRCPKCERALIYDQKGVYCCPQCSYESEIIPKCANCGGIVFKNVGLGTQKVEKEVKNFFPSARTIVADASASKKKDFQEKLYADFSRGKADILIGTQMISKGWDLPRVSLIGIIDVDNMLSLPDFSTQEKAFGLLVQAAGRAGRPGSRFPGTVVIQTFQPENKIIKLAADKNFPVFYEEEMEERNSLGLPPFGRLIRLVFQDYKKEKVERECLKLYESIKKIPGTKTTRPHDPLLSKVRGKFRKQLLVKCKKISPALEKELRRLPEGWITDIDPISTL